MTDPSRAPENRYRMGLAAEQAGIKDVDELIEIITIGMRARHRVAVVVDELDTVKRMIENITR